MQTKTVLIVVLGVAAIAGGGYYVYTRRKPTDPVVPSSTPSLVADTRPVAPSSLVQSFLNSNNITKFSEAIRNLIGKQNGVIYKEQFDSLVSDRDKEQALVNRAAIAQTQLAPPVINATVYTPPTYVPPVYVAPVIVAKPYVAPVWDGVIKQPTVAPVVKTTSGSSSTARIAPSVHIQGLGWVELLR